MGCRLDIVREELLKKEEELSPLAAKSKNARREIYEEPSPVRTEFQRDRDRIIHSKAFRRLKHKTQVFISPQGDHFITRLTHTLQVSQIARTIARALKLNEDLTEAIALAHDIGHTPFGHAGEEALSELANGFSHNEQSIRVVSVIEPLNLTLETKDGILKHSKTRASLFDRWEEPRTLEGKVVQISDLVAYINHDVDDAIRAGLIEDIPEDIKRVLGETCSQRINRIVCDIIEMSWGVREGEGDIKMGEEVREACEKLRLFLFERIYTSRAVREEAERGKEIIKKLYSYFLKNPDKMPPSFSRDERGVVDYIAGMTDNYAERLAKEI